VSVIAEVPIGELVLALIDYRGKTPPKSKSGVPLVTAKAIKQGRILPEKLEFIASDTYATWMRRGIPRRGDILVTTEAPLGEVAQLKTDKRVALAQRVILLRPDPDLVNPQFVFHFLRSGEALARLRQRSSGTTVLGIRQPELRAVRIPLLPRQQQDAVAAVLDGFDELVAINERRIELLEGLTRSLYREWFVRHRATGRPQRDAAFRSRSAWHNTKLGDVAVVNRETIKATDLPDPFEYVDISSVGEGRIESVSTLAAADAPGRARRRVRDADTIWATVRPNRRSHALVHDPSENMIVSTGFVTLTAETVPATFLFEYASTAEFVDYLAGRATGSAYPAVRPSDFADAPLSIPPAALLAMFDKIADPALRLASCLAAANLRLASTRDLLLPRLVGGDVDITDVDLGALVRLEVA
jgi:type I restriction enzyme S subunit